MASNTPSSSSNSSSISPRYSIATPRLIIRSAIPSDAEALYRLFADPANFPVDDVDPNQSVEIYQGRIGRWTDATAQGRSAFMVVVRRADDQIVGFGGLNSLERGPPLEVEGDKPGDNSDASVEFIADTGLVIDHRYWRQGYAVEAFCATVDFGFDTLGCSHFTMDTAKENDAWRALVRKLHLEHTESQRPSWRKQGDWEYAYRFDRATWEATREAVQVKGAWPL